MLAVEHVQRLAPERQLARDHLEENDAKGVDVGTIIHRSGVSKLLGGHVGAGAKPGA